MSTTRPSRVRRDRFYTLILSVAATLILSVAQHRLAASYRAQHAADQQARIDALLLETIAVLARLLSDNRKA